MGSSCGATAKPADTNVGAAVRTAETEPTTLASAISRKVSKRVTPNESPPEASALSEAETKRTVVATVPTPRRDSKGTELVAAKRRPPPRAPPLPQARTATEGAARSVRSAPGSPVHRRIPAAPSLTGSPHREELIGVHQLPTAPSILLQRTSSSRTAGSGNGGTPASLNEGSFKQGGGYRKSAKADEDEDEALQRVAALIRRMQQNPIVPSQGDSSLPPSAPSPPRIGSSSSRGSRNSSLVGSIPSDLGATDAQFASFHETSSLVDSFCRGSEDGRAVARLINTPRTDLDTSVENAVALLNTSGQPLLGRRNRSSINFSIENA